MEACLGVFQQAFDNAVDGRVVLVRWGNQQIPSEERPKATWSRVGDWGLHTAN